MNAMNLQAIDGVSAMQRGEFAAPALAAVRNSEEDQKRMAEMREQVKEAEKANTIDPDRERERQKEEQQKKHKKEQGRRNRGPEHGRFVDFTA